MNIQNIIRKIQPCQRVCFSIFRRNNASNFVSIISRQNQRFSTTDTCKTDPKSKNKNETSDSLEKIATQDARRDETISDSEISWDEDKRQKRMIETGRYIVKDQIPIHGYKVSEYDKFCLVYLGRYPSMAEVPPFVEQSKIKLCHDLMRIRYNIWSILLFSVFALFTILSYEKHRKQSEAEYMKQHYGRK